MFVELKLVRPTISLNVKGEKCDARLGLGLLSPRSTRPRACYGIALDRVVRSIAIDFYTDFYFIGNNCLQRYFWFLAINIEKCTQCGLYE